MPILHKHEYSHHANLMIQYMVAHRLRDFVPGLRLSNFDMPDWRISCPAIPHVPGERDLSYRRTWEFDAARLAYLLRSGLCDRISWSGWGQRMEYFPDRHICKDLFRADADAGQGFGSRHVVCPIRSAELLSGEYPLYPLMPVSFYRDMIDRLACTPVFMGQTEPNPYTDELRQAFPTALFLPSQGPFADFQTIRRSVNIILPVSTFAWLAAWLSDAERIILPLFGFFDPSTGCNLLPLSEPQFEFWRLPPLKASPVQRALLEHRRIEGQWSLESTANLLAVD